MVNFIRNLEQETFLSGIKTLPSKSNTRTWKTVRAIEVFFFFLSEGIFSKCCSPSCALLTGLSVWLKVTFSIDFLLSKTVTVRKHVRCNCHKAKERVRKQRKQNFKEIGNIIATEKNIVKQLRSKQFGTLDFKL